MSRNICQAEKISLIEFNTREKFIHLQKTERLTITLITNGKVELKINENTILLTAPCIFLSSCYDNVKQLENTNFTAKSLHFHPSFVNKSLTFEKINNNNFDEIADDHDCKLISPFLTRNENFNGIIKPLPQVFLHISEWFALAEKEGKIKNDRQCLYRVRRYLLQILFSLEDYYHNDSNRLSDESIVDIVLEHIHANYSNEISLDSLCNLVYLNRTSLTQKFKARTSRTPIDYLLHYRLSIACELLTNSKLSISRIAEATGFKYETYFIRQFTAKIGLAPTQYRRNDGFETLNTNESRIVDEF